MRLIEARVSINVDASTAALVGAGHARDHGIERFAGMARFYI